MIVRMELNNSEDNRRFWSSGSFITIIRIYYVAEILIIMLKNYCITYKPFHLILSILNIPEDCVKQLILIIAARLILLKIYIVISMKR